MTGNVLNLYPADDFQVVASNASESMEAGIIIGYDHEGELTVYGGGLIDGRRPALKDWLWIIESFKAKMLAGDFSDEG